MNGMTDADFSAKVVPARKLAAVTPSDTTVLSGVRGLYVGVTGDVAVLAAGDAAAQTFKAVPAGTILPVEAAKVMATNTTATNILALIRQ